jgi:hypothetical protein
MIRDEKFFWLGFGMGIITMIIILIFFKLISYIN